MNLMIETEEIVYSAYRDIQKLCGDLTDVT